MLWESTRNRQGGSVIISSDDNSIDHLQFSYKLSYEKKLLTNGNLLIKKLQPPMCFTAQKKSYPVAHHRALHKGKPSEYL